MINFDDVTKKSKNFLKKIIQESGLITLIFSNKEINDVMKIVKSLEDAGLLIKVVSETVENEVKKQKGGFLVMLAATLGASLSGSMLTGNRGQGKM